MKDAISKMKVRLKFYTYKLRAKYYGLFYQVGNNCKFQKIVFHKPLKAPMGRKSIQIGDNVFMFRNTELVAFDDKPIIIGDGTFINQQCTISPNVTIGKNVSIGHKVSLITDTHDIGTSEKRAGNPKYLPIVIGDGCWIGTNATILSGVTVGKGTIIAAGSVVNRDCEPDSLYGGVPARLIRKLDLLESR